MWRRDRESVLRLRSWSARRRDRDRGRRIWVCNRGWRIGVATAITISAKAKSNGEVERIQSRTAKSKSNSEPIVPSLFFLSLSLSLSLRAGASPSPLALSLFFEKWEFEGKIKTETNLHPLTGQLKSISRKCIFRAQPNTRKYGKAFSEMLFTQNTALVQSFSNKGKINKCLKYIDLKNMFRNFFTRKEKKK